jgi:hypothetical protein
MQSGFFNWMRRGERSEEEGCAGDTDDVLEEVEMSRRLVQAQAPLCFKERPAAGGAFVAEVLLRNQPAFNTSRLYITNSWFGDDQGEELAAALAQNTWLKELRLSRCRIGQRGFKSIAEALKINKTLTTLKLDNIVMGLPCAEIMADMLVSNSSLELLSLTRCSVGDLGARAVAKALEINTSIRQLEIFDDAILDAGALSLADALASTTSLQEIDLNRCCIGQQGALALARAWGSNLALNLNRFWVQGIDCSIDNALEEAARQEAARVRALIFCRREKLVAFGMAMMPRLGGGPGEETTATTAATATSSGSESKACVFHLMDGDVFKLIGEAYRQLLREEPWA